MEDTAWHPAGKAELEKWGVVQRTLFKIFLGSPLKLWASVGHWALWHFDLSLYTDRQKPRVSPPARPSLCLCFGPMSEGAPFGATILHLVVGVGYCHADPILSLSRE